MRRVLGHAMQIKRGVGRDQATIEPVLGVAIQFFFLRRIRGAGGATAAGRLLGALSHLRLDRTVEAEILFELLALKFRWAPVGAGAGGVALHRG